MHVGHAGREFNGFIGVFQSAFVAMVEQVEQRLCNHALGPAVWLEFLHAAAGKLYDAIVAQRHIGLRQAQVDLGVIGVKLSGVRIGYSSFSALSLCQRLFSLLQVCLYVCLCFHKLTSHEMYGDDGKYACAEAPCRSDRSIPIFPHYRTSARPSHGDTTSLQFYTFEFAECSNLGTA